MIPRYSRSQATAIWHNKYQLWLRVELAAAEALAHHKVIPKKTATSLARVLKSGKINPTRIDTLEKQLGHDVIAFLTHIAEQMGDESRFVHYGMTSSDLLDTTIAIQLKQSGELLQKDLKLLVRTLERLAKKHQHTATIGRSHGIHAEPTSFGLKLLSFAAEFKRGLERLTLATKQVAVCQLSGAVGTFAHLDPVYEKTFAKKLGLGVEPISTQVVARDRHGFFFAVLASVASSLERLAVEIRHLARNEVGEALEPFGSKQKGSSAMPHKRNPVLTENITGLARLVRGYAIPMLENVALWHERDISHSSVERVAAPDAVIALDFALVRMERVIKGLEVRPKAMANNLAGGQYASQGVLLGLIKSGMKREQAYRLVQTLSIDGTDIKTRLGNHKQIQQALTAKQLDQLLDPKYYLRHTATLFKRYFTLTK